MAERTRNRNAAIGRRLNTSLDNYADVQRRTNALGVGGQAARDEYGVSPEPRDELAIQQMAGDFLIKVGEMEAGQASPIDVLKPILDLYGTLATAEANSLGGVARAKAAGAATRLNAEVTAMGNTAAAMRESILDSDFGPLNGLVSAVQTGQYGAAFEFGTDLIANADPSRQLHNLMYASTRAGVSPEEFLSVLENRTSPGADSSAWTVGIGNLSRTATLQYEESIASQRRLIEAQEELDEVMGGLGGTGREAQQLLRGVVGNLFGPDGVNIAELHAMAGIGPREWAEITANPETLNTSQRLRNVAESLLGSKTPEPWQTDQEARAAVMAHPGYRPWAEANGYDPGAQSTFVELVDTWNRNQSAEQKNESIIKAFNTISGTRENSGNLDLAWANLVKTLHPQRYAEYEDSQRWEPEDEIRPEDENLEGGFLPREPREPQEMESGDLEALRQRAASRQYPVEASAEDGFASYQQGEDGSFSWQSKDGRQQGRVSQGGEPGAWWAIASDIFGQEIPAEMQDIVRQARQQNLESSEPEEALGVDEGEMVDESGMMDEFGLYEDGGPPVEEAPAEVSADPVAPIGEPAPAGGLDMNSYTPPSSGSGGSAEEETPTEGEAPTGGGPTQGEQNRDAFGNLIDVLTATPPEATPTEAEQEFVEREGHYPTGGEEGGEEVFEEEAGYYPSQTDLDAQQAEEPEPGPGPDAQGQAEIPREKEPVGMTNYEAVAHNITPTSPSAAVAANPSTSMADGATGRGTSARAGWAQTRTDALLASLRNPGQGTSV